MKVVMLVAAIATAAAAPISSRRSMGFAGSTPVGLDGLVAMVTFDCDTINADPRRGRVRTPISDDCRLLIPSPDGRSIARTEPDGSEGTTLRVTGNLVVKHLLQPTVLLWTPDSSGFLLSGGEGSGQVSHLRYFYQTDSGWRRSTRLADVASQIYRGRFDCRGGAKSYTNTSGWGWTNDGLLRIIVQEGVHSKGCLQPHEDRNILFEVIGDPVSGHVASAREIAALP